MSRLKKFAHSLLSGYVLLGANIIYTLASVPLALHYLLRPEFGLWALTTQIAGYIALIDAGMSPSVTRILIDYKDNHAGGHYGSVIKTGALVNLTQGSLIFIVGVILAPTVGTLLHIPVGLQHQFAWLLVGQSALMGIAFALRIFGGILFAHQRFDISNHGQTVLLIVGLFAMWGGFACGLGVYSFLLAQAAISSIGFVHWAGCLRLKLFPKKGEWGRVSRQRFKEIFFFGRDIFLLTVGGQFVNASQTILLTRFLGLDVVAIWSVCTRPYTMLTLLVWRITDYSTPTLVEMMVRGERDRLLRRFKDISLLCINSSILAGVLFAVCNHSFVLLWTQGKIHWTPVNDLLLAFWFFLNTTARTHTGFASMTKQFGFLRYVYLFEGLTFIGLNILIHGAGGVTLMLMLSIACTLSFSFPYGLRRTAGYFNLRWWELAGWYSPTWQLAWRLIPVAAGVWWVTHDWHPKWQLPVNLVVTGLWGGIMLLRHGLDKTLQIEVAGRLPLKIKWIFKRIVAN